MFSSSLQNHLWRLCPDSLSTRESQLFSELLILQRDSPLLKEWPKFLHSIETILHDFLAVVVFFAVLPKQCGLLFSPRRCGSLLPPPCFNISRVLVSPLCYNFKFTSCGIWRVAQCQFCRTLLDIYLFAHLHLQYRCIMWADLCIELSEKITDDQPHSMLNAWWLIKTVWWVMKAAWPF